MEKDQNTSPEIQENIIWKRTKILLRFWWRHFLVIPVIPFILIALFRCDLDATLTCVFAIMFFAVFDNLKCNYKSIKNFNSNQRNEYEYLSPQQRYPLNSELVGTPTYLSELGRNRY